MVIQLIKLNNYRKNRWTQSLLIYFVLATIPQAAEQNSSNLDLTTDIHEDETQEGQVAPVITEIDSENEMDLPLSAPEDVETQASEAEIIEASQQDQVEFPKKKGPRIIAETSDEETAESNELDYSALFAEVDDMMIKRKRNKDYTRNKDLELNAIFEGSQELPGSEEQDTDRNLEVNPDSEIEDPKDSDYRGTDEEEEEETEDEVKYIEIAQGQNQCQINLTLLIIMIQEPEESDKESDPVPIKGRNEEERNAIQFARPKSHAVDGSRIFEFQRKPGYVEGGPEQVFGCLEKNAKWDEIFAPYPVEFVEHVYKKHKCKQNLNITANHNNDDHFIQTFTLMTDLSLCFLWASLATPEKRSPLTIACSAMGFTRG